MDFWYRKKGLLSILMLPLALLFWLISMLKKVSYLGRSYRSSLPVICVGNIVVGGSGKTPVVIKIVEMLQAQGLKVAVVSRGYKSSLSSSKGVVIVDDEYSADEVGDEPLMIYKKTGASVYVSPDRSKSAKVAENHNCDVIVMDDGMQNYTLKKDIIISVFNGKNGVGNGFLMPAGCLRESLFSGVVKSDMAIFMGDDSTGISSKFKSFVTGKLAADKVSVKELKKVKNYIAFAGIGKPEKFFKSLNDIGLNVLYQMEFEDHYSYSDEDIKRLLNFAKQEEATLVTTEKDFVKISKKFKKEILVLPVAVEFSKNDLKKLEKLLHSVIVK
ncbi:MAG: tetraacyldisaccharide 4'-kinase [Alphaproteobacteria bacterium]|jgi:tetraacyldisaccharide 4'-kinase|nr:tetraacyldisaccharide 4'-kinase [Alphaproteobacteria bacterium]